MGLNTKVFGQILRFSQKIIIMLVLLGQRFHLAGSLCLLWVVDCIRIAQKAPGSQLCPKDSSRVGSWIPAVSAAAASNEPCFWAPVATARGVLVFSGRAKIYSTEPRPPLGRCGVTRHWVPCRCRFGLVIVGIIYCLAASLSADACASVDLMRRFSAGSKHRRHE